MHRSKLITTMAIVPALAFGASACGDDKSSSTNPTTPPAQTQGTQTPAPVAQIDSLGGETTSVALDKGFVEALGQLKLTPAAVGDAKITEDGNAVFPITGGNVTYYEPGSISPYVQGMINHDGSGLSLTSADGKQVELTDFVVDPAKSVLTGTVSVDGKVAAESAPLFFLDGRTLKPLAANDDGTAVLQGTTVKLKDEAAELLNTTFGTDALAGGLVIGVATITVSDANAAPSEAQDTPDGDSGAEPEDGTGEDAPTQP